MRILVLRVHGTGRSRTYWICQMFITKRLRSRDGVLLQRCVAHSCIAELRHSSTSPFYLFQSTYGNLWAHPSRAPPPSPPQWKKLHALTDSRITWSNSGSFFAMDGPRQAGRCMRHGTWVYCFQTCLQFEACSM